jgi:rod shape-determining protein MreD
VAADAVKVAVLVFLVAILQASVFNDVVVLDATPNVVLVTLAAVALLRGSIFGAAAGFFAGLVLDVANLQTLGATSLLFTLAGYWIGRYGETTGRDRAHAPFLSIAVVTFLYALGELLLRFVLGEPAPARTVLLDTLFQTIALNLLVTAPVYWLGRRLFRPETRIERAPEVELVG